LLPWWGRASLVSGQSIALNHNENIYAILLKLNRPR
jgi:hypothetical protein